MISRKLLRNVATLLLVLACTMGLAARLMSTTAKPAEHYKVDFSLADTDLKFGDKAGSTTFLGLTTASKTALQFKAENCYEPITVVPEPVYENTQSDVDDRHLLTSKFEAKDVYLGKIIEPLSTFGRAAAFITIHVRDAIFIQRHTIEQTFMLRIYTSKSCQIDRETTLAMANTAQMVIEKLKY